MASTVAGLIAIDSVANQVQIQKGNRWATDLKLMSNGSDQQALRPVSEDSNAIGQGGQSSRDELPDPSSD